MVRPRGGPAAGALLLVAFATLSVSLSSAFVLKPLKHSQGQQQSSSPCSRGSVSRSSRSSRSSSIAALKEIKGSEPETSFSSSPSSDSSVSRQGFFGGFLSAAVGMLAISTASSPLASWARPEGVNRPELLPKEPTNVIDLERFLTSGQKKRLNAQLASLEKETGIKVRLLCQRYPDTPGLAIKDFWALDDKSIVMVVDKGPANIKQVATRNLMNFNVGSGLQLLLPPAFWNRVRSRFGSIFYLRSHGDDEAIIATINTIDTCIRLKGCVDVPKGVDEEEGVFSFLK